jgi:hypothetical protein
MNHLTHLIASTPDFDKSINTLQPPQLELHRYYENLSFKLIEYIYQCKTGSRNLFTEDDHLRNSLIIRDLYRYVPQSKRCFPFESNASSTDAVIRQTRSTNIALQIRVQLCSLVTNPIAFAILTELIVHLDHCITTDLRATRNPCFDICKILLTSLPFDHSLRNKHLNLEGYLKHLGKRILRARYLQPFIGFHRATNEVNSYLVTPTAYEPLLRHLSTNLDMAIVLADLPARPLLQRPAPPERLPVDDDTPTNLTPSPRVSTDTLDPYVPPKRSHLSSMIKNSSSRKSLNYQRTRHQTRFYVWSYSDNRRIVDHTSTSDVRRDIFDIINSDELFQYFSIKSTDYNPPSSPGPMLLKAFILEHFNYIEKTKHSSFQTHNTNRSYPTVQDCINVFHMISLGAENERLRNYESPTLMELTQLMPITYELYSRPILDGTREFDSNVRRLMFWTLPQHATSFSYYSFLQLCIHLLSPNIHQTEKDKILNVPFGTMEEFYSSYPRVNVHLIRMWNFYRNLDADIANAPDAPYFTANLQQFYMNLRSRSNPLLHDRLHTTYVNGSKFTNHTIAFSSTYDNPSVYRSELDLQDGNLLVRLGAKFLPTHDECLRDSELEDYERTLFADTDYDPIAETYHHLDGDYYEH